MSKSKKQAPKPMKQKPDKRRILVSIIAGIMVVCMLIPMVTMIFEFL